jgi:hypothetical protein
MVIESLTICHWSSTGREDEVISNPTWANVESAIRLLDNAACNDVYLRPINATQDTFLCIGGGAGRYIVSGSENGTRFPTLSNPEGATTKLIPLCVGGQLAEYPSRWVVDLHHALTATRKFYDTGTFDCGVAWEDV